MINELLAQTFNAVQILNEELNEKTGTEMD